MKKLVIFALISLLLIPNLASASFWYKDIKVEKNISESLVAGSTDSIIVTFKNSMPFMGSLIAKLNITEDTGKFPVWLGDFKVKAVLNSTSLYPGYASSTSEMNCTEKESGIFYCFSLTEIEIKWCINFDKKVICWVKGNPESYIVLPKSINNLMFYVTFNSALIPSDYDFGAGIYKGFGIPKVDDPIKRVMQAEVPVLFNTSESDTILWITTNEGQSLTVYVILYEFVIQEQFIPTGLIPIKFVGIEANDTENITSVELRIYYDDDEIPEWVDENSLRLFYYDDTSENPEEWNWEAIDDSDVNIGENYVWGRLDHLSLFGILGSPSKEVVYLTPPSGGGGMTIYTSRKCEENWTCTEWSECINGTQTRTCTDLDDCGTTENKPAESQACVCVEDWECSEWSTCINGTQTRSCIDKNDCGATKNKPLEEQACIGEEGVGPEGVPSTGVGITGLIVGVLKNPMAVGLIFVIIIIITSLLYWKRSKKGH